MAYIQDKNGNYKRTVRCSHCYETGHNRSSCPHLKEELKGTISKYKTLLDNDVWGHPHEKVYAQRRFEWATNQLNKAQSKGKNRKCGFCSDYGHTRRTCQYRKDKTAEKLKQTLDTREKMRDALLDIGFGPSALVNVAVRDDRFPSGVLGVVKSIDFETTERAHVYDGGQWTPRHNHNVCVKLLQPIKDYWGSEHDEVKASMPVSVLNLDGHELHPRFVAAMRERENMLALVSPSECDESAFDSDDFDSELVSKWVLKNIVDP